MSKASILSAVILLATVTVGCSENQANPAKQALQPRLTKQVEIIDNRDYRVEMSDKELKEKLSPEQYRICKQNGTEPPFRNAYWDNKEHGIYVDVISGEPLFSSTDKFDSGTGWPSFTRPIRGESVQDVKDTSHGMVRTEVRSKNSDSHLGHVFPDGPQPTGLRYCINSASLRFIPKDKLSEEGYEAYEKLFAEAD